MYYFIKCYYLFGLYYITLCFSNTFLLRDVFFDTYFWLVFFCVLYYTITHIMCVAIIILVLCFLEFHICITPFPTLYQLQQYSMNSNFYENRIFLTLLYNVTKYPILTKD
mgnify:CR=1 FL=1